MGAMKGSVKSGLPVSEPSHGLAERTGFVRGIWLYVAVLLSLGLVIRQFGAIGSPCTYSLGNGDWPPTERLWEGGDFTFLGSAIWYKRILFIPVQVYEAGLYIEEEPAVRSLQQLDQDGFFEGGYTQDNLAAALDKGEFRKLLQIRLLRTVTAQQFSNELGKELRPRLDAVGAGQYADPFFDYFKDRDFSYLASFLGLWEVKGVLTGDLFPPGFTDFEHAKLGQNMPSQDFCRALFDIYIGKASIVPEGRETWTRAALKLLQASRLERHRS